MASGTTRDGKPVQVNDQASVAGIVIAVTGAGSQASLTIQCNGSSADGKSNAPYNITVLATDVAAATQSL
jgi:hypothetical protein